MLCHFHCVARGRGGIKQRQEAQSGAPQPRGIAEDAFSLDGRASSLSLDSMASPSCASLPLFSPSVSGYESLGRVSFS